MAPRMFQIGSDSNTFNIVFFFSADKWDTSHLAERDFMIDEIRGVDNNSEIDRSIDLLSTQRDRTVVDWWISSVTIACVFIRREIVTCIVPWPIAGSIYSARHGMDTKSTLWSTFMNNYSFDRFNRIYHQAISTFSFLEENEFFHHLWNPIEQVHSPSLRSNKSTIIKRCHLQSDESLDAFFLSFTAHNQDSRWIRSFVLGRSSRQRRRHTWSRKGYTLIQRWQISLKNRFNELPFQYILSCTVWFK